jgi:hypothetical protein
MLLATVLGDTGKSESRMSVTRDSVTLANPSHESLSRLPSQVGVKLPRQASIASEIADSCRRIIIEFAAAAGPGTAQTGSVRGGPGAGTHDRAGLGRAWMHHWAWPLHKKLRTRRKGPDHRVNSGPGQTGP